MQQHNEKSLILITRQLLYEHGAEHAMRAVTLDISLSKGLGLDSISKAQLLARVADIYQVELAPELVSKIDRLADLIALLETTPEKNLREQELPQLPFDDTQLDLIHTQSLQEVLLRYTTYDPNRPHIYLENEDGEQQLIRYQDLLHKAQSVAAGLAAEGINKNDLVAVMLPTSSAFFYCFMGVLLAGAVPVPIYPPFYSNRLEEYALREAQLLSANNVKALITFAQAGLISKILKAHVPSLEVVTTARNLLQHESLVSHKLPGTDEYALLQFTSGSTGDPKAVMLKHQHVLANIRALGQAIDIKLNDHVVSWLPLYHDMGLMSWLSSLYYGVPITILSPATFLNAPESWLWAIHYHHGTISAAPNFAYELCVNKINDRAIVGLDLSSWRLSLNGAEPVSSKTLQRFYDKFKNYGLKKQALTPVYGLAENTVALTVPDLNAEPVIDRIDREIFSNELRAVPAQTESAWEFVAVGQAIPEHEIRVVDHQNEALPERFVGHVQFRGPSAAHSTQEWQSSGDLGYIAQGQLFITGREKDVIIKAGHNIYPEALEAQVNHIKGIRRGRVIAFGVHDAATGTEKIVVVAETKIINPSSKKRLIKKIKERVMATCGVSADDVLLVLPKTLPKTSSGKLMRNACKSEYLSEKLAKPRPHRYWQMSRLVLSATGNLLVKTVAKIAKVIYSVYVWLVMIITLLVSWAILMILPRQYGGYVLKCWSRVFFFLCFCPLHTKNKHYFKTGRQLIYAANHASYLDAIALFAVLPTDTLYIGKKALLELPLLGGVMKRQNYITVDHQDDLANLKDLQKIQNNLKEGHSVLIFPEGTFTYASGLRSFKNGAFQLAVDFEIPICPVALKNTRIAWRDRTWLFSPTKITITAGPIVEPQAQGWEEVGRLKTLVRRLIAKHCGEPLLG